MKNRKVGTLFETRERLGTDKRGIALDFEEANYENEDEDSGKEPETWDVFLSRVKEEQKADPSTLSGIADAKKKVRIGFLRKVTKVF